MKQDWKPIVVALILGVLLGMAIFRWVSPHGFWNNPQSFQRHMIRQLTRKLDLSPDQEAKVSLILEDTRHHIEDLRKELRPRFDAVREDAHRRIREVLNAAQQAKFDVMAAKMKERLEKRKERFSEKPDAIS